MGILKRLHYLWNLSKQAEPPENALSENGKAEFIFPSRVDEILSAKPGATIDEVIIQQ